MKNGEDKLFSALFGLFGAGLGFLIFAAGLGGWEYLFTSHTPKPWNGLAALVILTSLGFGWGLIAYKHRDKEFGGGGSGMYHDETGAVLFTKRLMVIASSLAALYFIWQLAKGV